MLLRTLFKCADVRKGSSANNSLNNDQIVRYLETDCQFFATKIEKIGSFGCQEIDRHD
jgi:hypothetical protein